MWGIYTQGISFSRNANLVIVFKADCKQLGSINRIRETRKVEQNLGD